MALARLGFERSTYAEVRSFESDGHQKVLRLDDGQRLTVHRFASVGEGDRIKLTEGHGKQIIEVPCVNGIVQIDPIYDAEDTVELGFTQFRARIKEITNRSELDGFQFLSQFHNRGGGAFGRRAVLALVLPEVPVAVVAGYIELTTAFMLSTPRGKLFDAPFSDRAGVTSWSRWDLETRKKFTNLVVRISRCVVHPEFRGLGLAQKLVQHAARFCGPALASRGAQTGVSRNHRRHVEVCSVR
jgi:uncharacterized protein